MPAFMRANLHLRSGLFLLAAVLAATPATAENMDHGANDGAPTAKIFRDMFKEEGRSEALCHSKPDRIFVRHKRGTACIAYVATKGFESLRRAVVYIEGDNPPDLYQKNQLGDYAHLKGIRTALQKLSETMKVRYIRIARMGLDGSSGNHARRRLPEEALAIDATIDALKIRLGFDEVIFATQSRGSLVAASLMTFGRKDVTCAALGSGVYEHARFIHDAANKTRRISFSKIAREVYDPSQHIESIAADKRRRIFVLGDPDDSQVPFDQQERFALSVADAGHHARLVKIAATGDNQHGATQYALSVAGLCANDRPDAQILERAEKMSAKVEKKSAQKVLDKESASGSARR